MPRKRWIDKNASTTYQLLYRSQDDPLLNDSSAGDRALFAVPGSSSQSQPSSKKSLHITDLEDELDFSSMRENEGEAAEHRIYFDDTSYDYMQHMRDIGQGSGDAHFVDGAPVKVKGKRKSKTMKLGDALREASLEEEESEAPSLVDTGTDGLSTFSRSTKQRTYQDMQDIPDEIAGFQPDMDPRLREALEALEDDAFVDAQDEEDVFGALGLDGKQSGELDLAEFEAKFEEDDGWESDRTEKAQEQTMTTESATNVPQVPGEMSKNAAIASAEDGDWLRDFAKFKRDTLQKPATMLDNSVIAGSDAQAKAPTLYTLNGTPLRQKKRKGALTNPSAYSMTSSSLARTEGQQLLDARFDRIEAMYTVDEGDEFDGADAAVSMTSGMIGITGNSKASNTSKLSTTSFADGGHREDLDGMMDDFLGVWNKSNPGGGKRKGTKGKRGKHGNEAIGIAMLDEVRSGLGPAKLRASQRA